MTAELFKQEAGGLDILHVPVSRAWRPRSTDLLGGQVQVVFVNPTPSLGYITAGSCARSRITTASALGNVARPPTMGEFVPGYEASSIFGLGAPRNTPAGNCRQAQQGDQCRPRRSRVQARSLPTWMVRCFGGSPGRFRQAHRGRKPTNGAG
jgi:tripartite-type tricarboxylate transporter receptor subunit TctC